MTNFISDLNSDRHHFLFIFLFFKYFFSKNACGKTVTNPCDIFFLKKNFLQKTQVA